MPAVTPVLPRKSAHRQDLLEILDDRDGARSTIITSQLPTDRWHEHLGDPTVADAILDRVVHLSLFLEKEDDRLQ